MNDAWDQNAKARHEQILSGRDVSLSMVLVPTIMAIVRSMSSSQTSFALEVGCGTGYLTGQLAEALGSIVAIDPSAESVLLAREYLSAHKNVEIAVSSIESFGSPVDGGFDLVISSMALQAAPDLDASIESISTLTKPRGRFIFAIPHPCFWPSYKNIASSKRFNYHDESHHSIPFTISNDRKPLPAHVPYYHRPLERYCSCLEAHGMTISNLQEPFPDESVSTLLDEPWESPHFLVFECNKSAI